jgi:chemotaxis-related protein WspB
VKESAYGLDIVPIREIIPFVELQALPHAPDFLAGMLNYHGAMVPVIDVTQLLSGDRSRPLLSTRIIIVTHVLRDGETKLVGLLAEGVTEAVSYKAEDVKPLNITIDDCGYLGGFIADELGTIQLIHLSDFINDKLPHQLDTVS